MVVADGAEATMYFKLLKLPSANAEPEPDIPLTFSNKRISSSCKLCGLGKVIVTVGEPV